MVYRVRCFAAALLFAPALAFAAGAAKPLPHYVLDAAQSKVKFVAIENSAPVEGAFKTFSADIHFDPDDLKASSITAEVDVGSVFTAYPDVAVQLLTPDWFNARQFPKATLRSTEIKMMPDFNKDDRHYYYASANLTIRDKTVPVEVEFVMERLDAEGAVAEGKITLQRRDFGVGQGKWQSTDEVEDVVSVTFRAVAKRVTP